MGPKGKSGSKKPISRIKRNNHKMHKMVKQGKMKPKSQPRYVPNSGKKEKSEKAWVYILPKVFKIFSIKRVRNVLLAENSFCKKSYLAN